MRKKIVYIGHPISGDVQGNKTKVRAICRQLALEGEVIPCAPYLEACEYLDDSISEERAAGIAMNLGLFIRGTFDETWLYGPRISLGMEQEAILSWDLGIPVIGKTPATSTELLKLPGNPHAQSSRDAVVRYLRRAGPIGRDELQSWLWKNNPRDIVLINVMIGDHTLQYVGGGLIGVCEDMNNHPNIIHGWSRL